MALFHMHAQMIGRSSGRSVVAAAAYRSASTLLRQVVDHETGLVLDQRFDYSKKHGIVFSQLFAPEGVDAWCTNRQQLWNKVEHTEIRKDAQYARDLDIALQKELTMDQNIELLLEFVQHQFVARGMIADVNVHMDNANNPHAHILLTTRALEQSDSGDWEFGKKDRSWGDRAMLTLWRKEWADLTNKYFQIYGIDKTITHESYETRGLGFIEATIHEGAATHTQKIMGRDTPLERKETNREIVQKNLSFIRDNPGVVLEALTCNKAVFTRSEMAKELDKLIHEIAFREQESGAEMDAIKVMVAQEYEQLFMRLASSDQLVTLCEESLSGEAIYTTQSQLSLEAHLLRNIEGLRAAATHSMLLKEEDFAPSLYEKLLRIVRPNKSILVPSEEQRVAVTHLAEGADLSVLLGRPGTGKSTVMATLVRAYHRRGYRVIGAAYSADASMNLAKAAGIEAHTIAKWQYDWRVRGEALAAGKTRKQLLPFLGPKDIFMVDEASMVDVKTMDSLLKTIKEAGAKVIFIGDPNQLSAIGQGGALDTLIEKVQPAHLHTIHRQRSKTDRTISGLLAEFKMEEAVTLLEKEERLAFFSGAAATRDAMVDGYMRTTQQHPTKSVVMLAYGNAEVHALNQAARGRLLATGVLKSEHALEGGRAMAHMGGMRIALGERVVALKNHRRLGLKNGQVGIVTAIRDNDVLDIRWQDSRGTVSTIDTHRYPHFSYGYALTAYKAQGKTYDLIMILIDALVGYESFNVMATRHREESHFFIDLTALGSILEKRLSAFNGAKNQGEWQVKNSMTALSEWVSRREGTLFAHDYMGYEDNPYVKGIGRYLAARTKTAELYATMAVWREEGANLYDHPCFGAFQAAKAERDEQAAEMVEGWQAYRKFVTPGLIHYRTLLGHAGKRLLHYGGLAPTPQAASLMEQYQAVQKLEKQVEHNRAVEHHVLRDQAALVLEGHLQNEMLLAREEQTLALLQLEHAAKQSELHACEWALGDVKHYLSKAFKQTPDQILTRWNQIKSQYGREGAWDKIQAKPELLGDLQGVGLGRMALNDTRAEAVYLLKQLAERLKGVDAALEQLPILRNKAYAAEQRVDEQEREVRSVEAHCLTLAQERHLVTMTQKEHVEAHPHLQTEAATHDKNRDKAQAQDKDHHKEHAALSPL